MNVYEIITEKILDSLKRGVVPWTKPWRATCNGTECGAFFNLKTKRAYKGVNTFLLAASGFESPYFASFKQIQAMGGQVKEGSKATQVVFWKPFEVEKDGVKRTIPLLRYYNVFNIKNQTTGLEDKLPKPVAVERTDAQRRADCEELVENMPKRPGIDHGGDVACYTPSVDRVRMPELDRFVTGDAYYSTLFHELIHSTGHESRVGRKFGDWFADPNYSKEELVAEMGAAFLCGHLGIESRLDESASYIQHWMVKISDDPKLVVHAAGAAQRAADFILGKMEVEDDETTEQKD